MNGVDGKIETPVSVNHYSSTAPETVASKIQSEEGISFANLLINLFIQTHIKIFLSPWFKNAKQAFKHSAFKHSVLELSTAFSVLTGSFMNHFQHG